MSDKEEISQLEKDFNEIEDAVNAKLREAAKAVKEAQAIAQTKGLSLMSDAGDRPSAYFGGDLELSFNTRDLERAMDSAGWCSSSWNC